MATEVELKLLIKPEDIAKLRRHPLLKARRSGRARTQHLFSIYFDTPDLALRRNRIALRVRRVGARWIQTVKGGGIVHAGLHRRGEWEDQVAHDRPDLTKIQDPELSRLFSSVEVRDRLQAVFVTEFKRATWLLQWDDGDIVELALDQGEVKGGDATVPLCEIELELKQGNPARLYQAALELQQTIPLRLEDVSKADRGYGLYRPSPPPLVKAVMPRITHEMSVAQAFQAIAWNCIGHWTANKQGVLAADDPEHIHQMRVALRRLRSALPLFGSAIPRESCAAIAAELRWLAGELGPARNWDVFVTETLPPILAQFPQHAGLARVRTEAIGAQAVARESARSALLSARYDRLLLTLGAWLLADGWQAQAGAEYRLRLEEPVKQLARKMLTKRHKTVHRHGHGLADMPPEERHQVRIAAKKLRYATEFFAALYPPHKTRAYLQALSTLQDHLGVLNDAATTRPLLAQLEGSAGGAELAHALGVIAGWNAGAVIEHLADMALAWEKFYREKPFWNKAA